MNSTDTTVKKHTTSPNIVQLCGAEEACCSHWISDLCFLPSGTNLFRLLSWRPSPPSTTCTRQKNNTNISFCQNIHWKSHSFFLHEKNQSISIIFEVKDPEDELTEVQSTYFEQRHHPVYSSVAQRKRVGLITQRSEDRNLVELEE
jgi:hypothetical protein